MFSTQNTLAVTKAAVAQLTSSGYMDETPELTALNDQYIVDLGEKLNVVDGSISENSPADIFFKALISQIGKIIVDTRTYTAQLPKLFVDVMNWGIMQENITVELSDVMIDEMWNPEGFINYSAEGGPAEGQRIAGIEFGCYKPPVSAKLFKKCHGIMAALTVAREQMFTAFRGIDEYNSFLAGLYNSVENTIQLKAEVYALMTVSMGIAKAKAQGNEINLLSEYNLVAGKTLRASQAFQDADFLKYALMRIAETKDNIKRFTELYNNHEHLTFAAEPQTILLSKFSNAAKFNVRANTYHEELLGIGDYDKVTAWQANIDGTTNQKMSFDAVSSISLSKSAAVEAGLLESTSGRSSYPINGVIGVIYDRMAMGITLDKKKTTSQYAASRDTVNYFYHNLANYIVNDNYPIVSFVVRDEAADTAANPYEAPTFAFATGELFGTPVSDMYTAGSSSVDNSTHTITIKAKKLTSGAIPQEWGKGYFLPFKITSSATLNSVEIVPTQGAGLVKLDSDMDGVVKLWYDETEGKFVPQNFVVVQTGANGPIKTVWTINASK